MKDKQWNKIFKQLSGDISDRRGLKWEWQEIDDDVMLEIKAAWRKIVEKGLCRPKRTAAMLARAEAHPGKL